eukprot:1140902-Pelagomonas_calceolata.AAC.2
MVLTFARKQFLARKHEQADVRFCVPPQVLQNELRKTHAKSQALEWIEELCLIEIVGKGGFGVVYKGTWKGSVAAVKVCFPFTNA